MSTPSGEFTGKIAIVTGASRGIGKAIAFKLAEQGASVVLTSLTEATLKTAASEITAAGGTVSTLAIDLRLPDGATQVVQHTLDRFGAIDIVVNNAGATRGGKFVSFTDADWADGFALKFFGAVRLSRAAWPHLQARRGSILNIAGSAGRTPNADVTIGGSVNAALLGFTKALADAGIKDGVKVNAINPGRVRTARLRPLLESVKAEFGLSEDEAIAHILKTLNFRRLGEPDDIANLATFVLSSKGDWFQGALIDMDGGATKAL